MHDALLHDDPSGMGHEERAAADGISRGTALVTALAGGAALGATLGPEAAAAGAVLGAVIAGPFDVFRRGRRPDHS